MAQRVWRLEVLLPRESNPSRPPVGRQNGGCWVPFEYAYCRRQVCNSRPEPPRVSRCPSPGHAAVVLRRPAPAANASRGERSLRDLHDCLVGAGVAGIRVSRSDTGLKGAVIRVRGSGPGGWRGPRATGLNGRAVRSELSE
jgi:hypothetical protein